MELNYNSKINLICTQCKETYLAYKCNIRKSKLTFCTSKCYGLWQRNKKPIQRGIDKPIRLCSIDNCNKKHFGKTYCKHHYSKIIIYKNRPRKVKKEKIKSEREVKGFIIKKGYKKLIMPNHPRSDAKGYTFEHIIILEQKLNRQLLPKEVCHHIDGNKLNNNPDNLITFKDQASHCSYHRKLQSASKCPGSENTLP